MNKPATAPTPSNIDHLSDYVAGVSKLPGKLAKISANQRSSELSLRRAAAALRSMAALNNPHRVSDFRDNNPNVENLAGASR
jgi:hypothetical protein